MTQITIQERLAAVANRNTQLLATLSDTEYATSGYQQSQNYITTLKKQIATSEKELKKISASVAKEYDEHKSYRDSHLKRLAYRFGGKKEKFEERATKEEKEWLDAVASELQIKRDLEQLNRALAQATKDSAELLAVVQVHHAASLEIDALYNSIFGGPTPEIPEEDDKESEVVQSGRKFDIVQLLLSSESQAKAVLMQAQNLLKLALRNIAEARDNNTMDCWGVGGIWAEMAEQSSLSQCQQYVSQTQMLVSQAQRIQPEIGSIGDMRVAQMNFMSDIVFDNIFSDMDMRARILETQRQLLLSKTKLDGEVIKAEQRVKNVNTELESVKRVLDEKRADLQKVRARVFETLLHGELNGSLPSYAAAPPGYTA